MSTKIYNGYIIQTDDIKLIMRLLGEIGKRYDKVASKAVATLAARMITNVWDCMATGNEINPVIKPESGTSIYFKVSQTIEERRRKIATTRRRDPLFDFEFEITIFPIASKTLAMLFCDNRTLTKILTEPLIESYPRLIEPYPYWDNTDRPDDVTDEEWRIREDDWDRAIGIEVPGRAGLTRTYHTLYGPDFQIADILASLDPLDERAKRLAEEILINQRCKELYPNPPKTPGDFMRDYAAIEAWVHEGSRLADKAAEIMPKLTNPTKTDLLAPLP